MRRILFTIMVAGLGIAVAPATALADHGHGDGHGDGHGRVGQNAATVASFSKGVLTVTLGDGSTVRGKVTDATQLECHARDNRGLRIEDRRDGGGDNGGGDNGGRGNGGGGDGHELACTTRALRPGTIVDEAELQISHGTAFWEKVELIVKRPHVSR